MGEQNYKRSICIQSDSLNAEDRVVELLKDREPLFQCTITQTPTKDDALVLLVVDASCHNLSDGLPPDKKEQIHAFRAQGKQVMVVVALDSNSTEVYDSGTLILSDHWLMLWEESDVEMYQLALNGLVISIAQKINEEQIKVIKTQRHLFDYWNRIYLLGTGCRDFANMANRCLIECMLPQNILDRRFAFYADADKLQKLNEVLTLRAPPVAEPDTPVAATSPTAGEPGLKENLKSIDLSSVKEKFSSTAKSLSSWASFTKSTNVGRSLFGGGGSTTTEPGPPSPEKGPSNNWTMVEKEDVVENDDPMPLFVDPGTDVLKPSVYGPRCLGFVHIASFKEEMSKARQTTAIRVPQSHSVISNKFRGKLEDPLLGLILCLDLETDIGAAGSGDRVQYKIHEYVCRIKLDNPGYKIPMFVMVTTKGVQLKDDMVSFTWRLDGEVDNLEWMQWFSQLLDICEGQRKLDPPAYNPLPSIFMMSTEHDWEMMEGAALPCFVPDEFHSQQPRVVELGRQGSNQSEGD